MTVRTIIINENKGVATQPVVRLASHNPAALWQHVGYCVEAASRGETSAGEDRDLNRAAQLAAQLLLEKVAARGITVEVVIDPFILPTNTTTRRLVPLILAIAENASASVEPGPGTVVLRTWWRRGYAGVDAVGIGGSVSADVRKNLMRPGFSTRVAEWDTGLGLHEANTAARQINGSIEVFDPKEEEGVGFRLAFPLKAGSHADPAESVLGLEEDLGEDSPALHAGWSPSWSRTTEVSLDVDVNDSFQA